MPLVGSFVGAVCDLARARLTTRFVCVHFAPHMSPKSVAARVANYDRLTSHLRFPSLPANASKVSPNRHKAKPFPRTSFNTTNHLFLFGDLNYRLSATSSGDELPPPDIFRTMVKDLDKKGESWEELNAYDQLKEVQKTGKSLVGFEEVPLGRFAPTYKRVIGRPAEYRFVLSSDS